MAHSKAVKQGASGGAKFSFRVEVEGVERTSQEFRRANRDVQKRAREAMFKAGQRTVLPAMQQKLPGRWKNLFVNKQSSGVFIGSRQRGPMNRALGWLDMGGKRPMDHGKRTGWKIIVTTLDAKREEIDTVAMQEVMKAFSGFETKITQR